MSCMPIHLCEIRDPDTGEKKIVQRARPQPNYDAYERKIYGPPHAFKDWEDYDAYIAAYD